MSYQDRIDIDRLYDLIYDAQSEQLKVVTREEFEQLFGSISSFKDMQELYYDKSEVYLKIVEVLKEAGVITEDTYNELIAKIQTAQNTADLADTKATNAVGTANNAQTSPNCVVVTLSGSTLYITGAACGSPVAVSINAIGFVYHDVFADANANYIVIDLSSAPSGAYSLHITNLLGGYLDGTFNL